MAEDRNSRASRRAVLRTGLTAAAGLGTLALGRAAVAQQAAKLDQKTVQYQETPKNGQMCSICANFEPPNACKLVSGTINPNGWCVAFAPKQA